MNKSSFNQSIKQSIHQTIHPSINQSNQSNRSNQSIGIQNYPFFILQNKRKTPQITALRLDTNKGIAYEGITQSPGTKLQVTTKPRWPVADGKVFLEHFLIVRILCDKWLWQVVLLQEVFHWEFAEKSGPFVVVGICGHAPMKPIVAAKEPTPDLNSEIVTSYSMSL